MAFIIPLKITTPFECLVSFPNKARYHVRPQMWTVGQIMPLMFAAPLSAFSVATVARQSAPSFYADVEL